MKLNTFESMLSRERGGEKTFRGKRGPGPDIATVGVAV
jgi:hypothetical protein